MLLSEMTWQQVAARLESGVAILLPTGSTEQHGPMGMIGTDTICASAVAERAADLCDAIVAPPLAYAPAPFNTGFAGTVSISEDLFEALAGEIFAGLLAQGFRAVFVVNGHGANLAPLRRAGERAGAVRISSWWDHAEVQVLRDKWYGDWEGMHATPSEVAITQALLGALPVGDAAMPPEKLSRDYIAAHGGDRHGPPDEHRARFPDGRVGSHSALARPEHGAALLDAAAAATAAAFTAFQGAHKAGA